MRVVCRRVQPRLPEAAMLAGEVTIPGAKVSRLTVLQRTGSVVEDAVLLVLLAFLLPVIALLIGVPVVLTIRTAVAILRQFA